MARMILTVFASLVLTANTAWSQDAAEQPTEPAADPVTTPEEPADLDQGGAEPDTPGEDEGSDETEEGIEQELKTIEDLLDLIDTWEGGADELQETYDKLDPELKGLVAENFESWALEGGVSLGGGLLKELAGDKDQSFFFSTSLSIGMTWPVGDYDLPIYYAVPDIPGPWAVGFNVSAKTDNFNVFAGAASFHWAYEYIGTTPFIDVGPAVRYDDGVAIGGHLMFGYGNILLQGYLDSEYTFDDNSTLTVVAGIRVPWLLFTLI